MKYYASAPSLGIRLSGPYKTQSAAFKAMRLTVAAQVTFGGIWPPDLIVWPDDRTSEQILEGEANAEHRRHLHHRDLVDKATRPYLSSKR